MTLCTRTELRRSLAELQIQINNSAVNWLEWLFVFDQLFTVVPVT